MELIAHRGACFDAPENSMAAFEEAVRQRADSIELDVRLSADGVPMVCHDERTGRLGTPDLPVEATAAARLAEVRLANGEPLPALEAVCAAFGSRIALDVELKTADPRVVRPTLDILAAHRLRRQTFLTSFHVPVLAEARRLGFPGRLGLLVGSKSYRPRQRLFEAWPLAAMRQVEATDLVIHHRLAHVVLRRWLHRFGLGCVVWTAVEDEAVAPAARAELYRRLGRLAVDGVIIGRVAEARPFLGGAISAPPPAA